MFHCIVLIHGMVKETSYLLDRKVRKKNQIPEYYACSLKELMKKIQD